MRQALARSEQPQSPIQRHPLFARAGRDAAVQWLLSAPLSMGQFRDQCFHILIADFTEFDDHPGRREAFNDAFALRIAQEIVSAPSERAANWRSEGVSRR
ncbi:Uncharacterised protein [Burkholderia pseudomallei]|nr:Uncharacterised protein [Burkholderia pseudomallei]CAJ7424970.1 Uncharacterised protein [Burkholderia pseudomallei]CAJ7820483.1 Uncharacterised protein [Burkholderia pseudomallei]